MRFLRIASGNNGFGLRAMGRRHFAVSAGDYAKRNYANNVTEYNNAINTLTAQYKPPYLFRTLYDDMVLDGVKPERETFHSLIIGTMKGSRSQDAIGSSRLQDAIFFKDEMKKMGLVPDVALFNYLISTCGRWKNSNKATLLWEEMKNYEVKPNGQTYVCLLNAFAAAGRLDRVLAIVGDMTAGGLGLNKFCYAGLITAHKNKRPIASDVASKIIELVEQSKGWASVDQSKIIAENVMKGISEEELYNLPTAEYVRRRGGFLNRSLTVYHVAFHACADLKNVEAMETLREMLEKDCKDPDTYIVKEMMRCYLNAQNLERGVEIFNQYMSSGKIADIDLFVTLIEGAMIEYTPQGMQIAQDTLVKMMERGFRLSTKMANDLLRMASGEKTGGYTMANMLWDTIEASDRIIPQYFATEAYYKGLQERSIPEDDPRLVKVKETLDRLKTGRS